MTGVIDKHDNGKWAKVPYIPGTTRKASHSYPKTWCSIEEAHAAYQQASDYCAGLFFAFVV